MNFALDRTRTSILESLGEQGVTVDPAKLTDINLLKRHVLKRCIYGVDLNPMAVELAKVSLWLDCFTLGAPLNFLDHHLRCGNSLIGATFKDLEEATKDELFTLPFEPLLRAINFVLFVSKMADATAAEVVTSRTRYDQARLNLAGYQIILDVLAARHFGIPEGVHAVLGAHTGLDFDSRDEFLASLGGDKERRLVAQIEALAQRPDRRFFHWEIEFPEVFFGSIDANETQIKHKDKIKEGSAGFDVIVGNPPYVRQEAIKPLKPYLKKTYQTYDSTNDLYVYFQEIEIRNLRVAGRMGMIVANKWMRSGYGERLRDFLQRTGQPLEVIDFGHSPIFPDADTFPCILLVTKRPRSLTEREQPTKSETTALLHETVQSLLNAVENIACVENEFTSELRRMTEINESRNALVQCLGLPPEEFSSRLEKLQKKASQSTRTAAINLQQKMQKRRLELVLRQLDMEKKLASLVEDAYGLTPEERALLRSTRPVRDPLDVFEAKIRRGSEENDVDATDE